MAAGWNLRSRSQLSAKASDPMSNEQEFRMNVAECERMAERSADPDERTIWLRMAAHWRRLIEDCEGASQPA